MSQDYNCSNEKLNEMADLKLNDEGKNFEAVVNSNGKNIADLNCNNNDHYHPEIRLLCVQKDSKNSDGSCGFNLSRSKWDPYPWVSAVDRNTPACNAGLKVGDCVLEVNGEDILGLRISEIANLVKVKLDHLSLLIWCTERDPTCDENSLCCGPMPLSLERLSASMQTILACLECPVCMDIVPAPVSQCQNGHILCIKCRSKSEKCPICRQHYSCVRSLIAEQIYSSILDAFKLHSDDDNSNVDMHMNKFRSSGRKLREKLFGAKYKKKQHQQNQKEQQSMLYETMNKLEVPTKIKSASAIGINDTTSYDLNLNNYETTLNRDIHQHHHGSGSLFYNHGNNILTPTNRFLAKILGKAHSLENLSIRNNSINASNSYSIHNNSNKTIALNNIHHSERAIDNENFKRQQHQTQQKTKEFSDSNYLKSLNYNIEEIKQFSQSANDLSSLSLNKNNHQCSQDNNNNPTIIAIPRCPSLNPLPTTIATIKTTTNSTLSTSIPSRQSGSLKGLNNYSNSSPTSYTVDCNDSTTSCGTIMSRKAISNASLSVHSSNTGLILHKRPSPLPSTSALSVMQVAASASAASVLNFPIESVEIVDFTDAIVNQSLTLTVPKINEIKRYRNNINVDVDNDVDDDDDIDDDIDSKKIKVLKLLDDVRRFLCPYDCSDDKFNELDLKQHIKKIHLVPIISFGTNKTEISLPLREPMKFCIIELNLNENIFWIKIDVNGDGSILVTALLQGTEDESSAFMLEGQLRNRADDKLLERQLITRSMVYSMMNSSWNIQQNIFENCNSISELLKPNVGIEKNMAPQESISSKSKLLNQIDKNDNRKKDRATFSDSNIILNDNNVTIIDDPINVSIDNIDVIVIDEFNTLNCISNYSNENNSNLKNSININDNDYIENENINIDRYIVNINDNNDDDNRKQVENVFFHYSCIKSTFNNNCKDTELLLKIYVKCR